MAYKWWQRLFYSNIRARAYAVSRLYPWSAPAESASLHVISEIWLLLQCAVALQHAEADALEQQTIHLHKCDHVIFFYEGGGGACD